MARRRIYYHWEIPSTVVNIVNSICADYDRRRHLINSSTASASESVLNRLAELNAVVDKALEEIEPVMRQEIISDISAHRGYYKSTCAVMIDKNAYYRRRRKLIHDIAITLSLI